MKRKIKINRTLKKAVFSVLTVSILLVSFLGVSSSWAASFGAYLDEVRGEEPKQLEKYKDRVRRDGNLLMLKTDSGAYITFGDTLGCDPVSWCRYIFLDYYKDTGFYVIFVRAHEGDTYIMISEKNGKEYYVMESPKLSPDRKRIVTVSASEHADSNGVYIWRMGEDELTSELSYKPFAVKKRAYYYFKRWKDNKTIELTKQVRANRDRCPHSNFMMVPVTLHLEDGGWKLYDDLSAQSVECGPKIIERPGSD